MSANKLWPRALTALGIHCRGKRAKRKHCWVYYHGDKQRQCIDCHKTESLWADFGLVPKEPHMAAVKAAKDKATRMRVLMGKAADTAASLARLVKCPSERAKLTAKAAALKAKADGFGSKP